MVVNVAVVWSVLQHSCYYPGPGPACSSVRSRSRSNVLAYMGQFLQDGQKVNFSLIFWKLRCDLTVWFLSDPGPIIVYTLAKEENRNMVTIHLAPSSCTSPQFASIKTCYVKFIWRYSWPNLFFPGEKWQTKAIKRLRQNRLINQVECHKLIFHLGGCTSHMRGGGTGAQHCWNNRIRWWSLHQRDTCKESWDSQEHSGKSWGPSFYLCWW